MPRINSDLARWGGRHQLSSADYHQVPTEWQAEPLLHLHQQLGGWFALGQSPRLALAKTASHYAYCHHYVWYNLANGVRAGDAACTELAIRFIEAHLIRSYSGYARERLVRALKHAALDESQKFRLSQHFLHELQTQNREHRFSLVFPLWQRVIHPTHQDQLKQILRQHGRAGERFTQQVVNHFFAGQSLAELALSE